MALRYQPKARIGDERRAGIRDERDGAALPDLPQQRFAIRIPRVIVIAAHTHANAIALQQLARHPRVLAGDDVGGGQGFESAQAHVLEVADRGRDDVEAGLEDRGLERRCLERIASAPVRPPVSILLDHVVAGHRPSPPALSARCAKTTLPTEMQHMLPAKVALRESLVYPILTSNGPAGRSSWGAQDRIAA